MTTFVTALLVLALIGVLTVLGFGVATMLRGGNPRRSNKLMQMRVVMQALALLLLAILMLLAVINLRDVMVRLTRIYTRGGDRARPRSATVRACPSTRCA